MFELAPHYYTYYLGLATSLYRMDKKGGDNDVIYPDIVFCVDGFEEVRTCTCTYNVCLANCYNFM